MKPHDCPKSITFLDKGKLYVGCDECIDSLVHEAAGTARHKREYEKKQYRKDLIQPGEREFVKGYGIEKAKEQGWTDEAIRKWG